MDLCCYILTYVITSLFIVVGARHSDSVPDATVSNYEKTPAAPWTQAASKLVVATTMEVNTTQRLDVMPNENATHRLEAILKVNASHSLDAMPNVNAAQSSGTMPKVNVSQNLDTMTNASGTHRLEAIFTVNEGPMPKVNPTQSLDDMPKVNASQSFEAIPIPNGNTAHRLEAIPKWNSSLNVIPKVNATHSLEAIVNWNATQRVDVMPKVNAAQSLDTLPKINAAERLDTLPRVNTTQSLDAIPEVNETQRLDAIPKVNHVQDTIAKGNAAQSSRKGPKRQNVIPWSSPNIDQLFDITKLAKPCRKSKCKLPNCSCGGTEIPGGIPMKQTPQIITITFDDAVTRSNYELFKATFTRNRTNPNGCSVRGTFYVSDKWTDYQLVERLYRKGHEIASHSINHTPPKQNSSAKEWSEEIDGQRQILNRLGKVNLKDIRGMRAPFLQPGGNGQFQMLRDKGFLYDSSLAVGENDPPQWPYTLDYAIPHKCVIPPCPTKSFPGIWEMLLVHWKDSGRIPCSMVDACHNAPGNEKEVYQLLLDNFRRHYTTNRAPFGMYYHATWFLKKHHRAGFEKFLDTVLGMPNVWIVTTFQALQWVQNPTPVSAIKDFSPWTCSSRGS